MMRLRALRLSEVGRFSSPVAIEGIGDGLNVLSGPNELGKSTLLDALDAVLTCKFSTASKEVQKLRPYRGGAPRIEAEFEVAGRVWRLRKQFLTSPSATLLDVASGMVLRNADAEARLTELCSATVTFDRFGLLWVRQQDFSAPEDETGGLGAYIASQVESAALDPRALAVHARVKEQLHALQTERAGRPRGEWLKAQQESRAAADRLARAAQAAAVQADRLEALAAAVRERQELTAPEAAAKRAEALATVQLRHADAAKAFAQQRETAKRRADALTITQSVEREYNAHRDAMTELDRLTQQSADARAQHIERVQRRGACEAELAGAVTDVERAETLVVSVEKRLQVSREAEREAERVIASTAERDRLSQRIADAHVASDAYNRAAAEAARYAHVTSDAVEVLDTALQDMAQLDSAFAAVAPEIAIDLLPSAASQVAVDGSPIGARTVLNPDRPLIIEIVGIGRITIAPNPATVSAEKRAQRERCRSNVEAAYAALGVVSLADAKAQLEARQAAEAAMCQEAARLKLLAPQGLELLVTAHAELSARMALAVSTHEVASVVTAEAELAAAKAALHAATARRRRCEADLVTLREEFARAEAVAAAFRARIFELEAHLGDDVGRKTTAARLAETLGAARAAFMAAEAAVNAWSSHPDANQVEALAEELEATQRSVSDAEKRLIALDLDIRGIEGALDAAGDADLETELESARSAADRASARLADIEADVQALTLLDREFHLLAEAGRNEISGPILDHIRPYLIRVFPNADLELGNRFQPSQLLRNGQSEPHAHLSSGTREQIAILVRLGLARLLADRGAAVPLILDDALVYSDDLRMAQMFAALQDAARYTQVIVLNCREHAFAELSRAPGATVLSIKPWPAAALAA